MNFISNKNFGSAKLNISAVIPAFNREQTIGRAIESVLAQSRPPKELIVVDDGSTDDTFEKASAFNGIVRVIKQKNSGASAARNRGVYESDGDWIAFLDSDDYWNPDHLARVCTAIKATNGEAGVYFTDLLRPPNESSFMQWSLSGYVCDGEFEFRDDGRDWALASIQPLMLQASVVRRVDFLEIGGIWEALQAREDTHFFFKLLVGRPSCAVNYCGTKMTSDDTSGGRLSLKYHRSEAYFEQTIMLYRDVLNNCKLSQTEYSKISHRLSAGHLGLAKSELHNMHLAQMILHLYKAFVTQPSRFFAAVVRRFGYFGTVDTKIVKNK